MEAQVAMTTAAANSASSSTVGIGQFCVLIPAYKPAPELVGVVRDLAERGIANIIVVDDGGGLAYKDIFKQVAAIPGTTVLHHATNLGKGAALKTGLNHAAYFLSDSVGIVTADADGQHLVEDILRVGDELLSNPRSLVMGARQFAGEVPFRSKLGNIATRQLMRFLVGLKLTDTQTGLRGIPTSMVPQLLKVESRGYEFELDMLLIAHRSGIGLVEVPIQTVYLDGNSSSHFNPLIDSMRIYFVLLRFTLASLLSALIDYSIFVAVFWTWHYVLLAQCVARGISMLFNYAAIKKTVFYSQGKHSNTFPKYLALVIVSGTVSYALIRLVLVYLPTHVIVSKLIAELLVFVMNFAVAREFVFGRAKEMDEL